MVVAEIPAVLLPDGLKKPTLPSYFFSVFCYSFPKMLISLFYKSLSDIYGLAFALKPLLICVYWLETMNQIFPIRTRVFLHVKIWWLKIFFLGFMVNYVLSPQSLVAPINSTNNVLSKFCHRQNLSLKVTIWSSSIIFNSINSNHTYFNFQERHWKWQMSLSSLLFRLFLSRRY